MGNTSARPHPRTRHKKQVHWKAADRPAPPGKPQLVSETEITPDVVTIRWNPPKYDGGSPITGYLVEHRRHGSPHWVRATPLLVTFTELSLSGLEPGWRYQFRVSAENAVGLSVPGELSELLTVTLQRSAVAAPRFIDELSDAVALENEKVEFTVNFLGQPAPRICWFKDGFEIFSSRRIRIITENDKSVLTIHQAALSDEGEIKCTATNRAGHASTKAKLTLEAPPSIRLPRQYEDGLLFELGEVIKLKVSIAGRPSPLVFWSHNNETIKNDERYEIESTDRYSGVRIQEAERSDRGEYQVKAVNKLGDALSSFLVTVTDKPSPPGRARVIMTLGKSVTISWNLPDDDGGCKIGNYIVEYFRIGWDVWLKAATCRQLTTTIGDLIEGSEYKFRVKAESPYGVSEPSQESDVIFIPDPKRGILTPLPRSRSQPRDILGKPPVAVQRKPRSQSSSRTETPPNRPVTPVQFYEGGVPVRPARVKVKSPSITPEPSPMVSRRNNPVNIINKNIFDRTFMVRDMAYGSPEIKVKKIDDEPKSKDLEDEFDVPYHSEKLNQLPSVAVKSTVNVIHHQNQSSSAFVTENSLRKQKSPSPKPVLEKPLSPVPVRKKSPSPKPVRESTPSPKPLRGQPQLPNSFRDKSPSPKPFEDTHPSVLPQIKRKSPGPVRFPGRARSKSPSPLRSSRSKSPSPKPLRVNHNLDLSRLADDKHDPLSNSSEFMLVLLPDRERGRGSNSDIKFDFDENSVPPPMSLSAPELGIESILFEPLRSSVSSTELLHEHAMARFYEAMAAEEAELESYLQTNSDNETTRRKSVEVPRIQINSKDDQVIVGLEKARRRLSGGASISQQLLWAQRRHSLRNAPDLSEIPENNLRKFPAMLDNIIVEKFSRLENSPSGKTQSSDSEREDGNLRRYPLTVEDKRELFGSRQRSESEEREEEEFEKVRARMALHKKDQQSRKGVTVVSEEEWDEDEPEYEESLSESETESSDDEDFRKRLNSPPVYVPVEEEIYNPRGRKIQNKSKSDEPFEILTKPNPLPDPNFKPKPILKRRTKEATPPKPVRKSINTNNPSRQRSLSVSPQTTNNAKEALYELEDSSRQRSFSLFPQNDLPELKHEVKAMRKRGSSPSVPYRNISAIAEISGMAAASVAMPQPSKPPVQRKKSEDEIKVVVDHYGDIVKSYGQKKKTIPQVYLNADDLKAAAERQSEEDLREMQRPIGNVASAEGGDDEDLDDLEVAVPDGSRRRSFVVEASSALLRTMKEHVSAVFSGEQVDDDVIPPDAEIIPSMQRRGSAQLNLNKRRPSKTPTKLEVPKTGKKMPSKSPTRGENWSNLRAPSPSPQGGKLSPSPMRRNSLVPPTAQFRRNSLSGVASLPPAKPKMKEITTQTAGYDDSSTGDPKRNVLLAAKQEELSAKAEFKVRTTVDYITDLAMFVVACWLYLFQNELLAIPVLAVMVYRQLKEEIKRKLPGWLLGKKKVKRK